MYSSPREAASRSALCRPRTNDELGRISGSPSPHTTARPSTAERAPSRTSATSAPTRWSTGTTRPSSWSSSASSRCGGATSVFRWAVARRCAAATASCDLAVKRSGCIVRPSLRVVATGPRPLDGDPHAVGLVGAVGDDLRPERSPYPLDLLEHLPLEAARALAHPPQLRASVLELALEIEDGLHAGEVQPLLGGHALDASQPLDVVQRIEAGVLRRALRLDQPSRLVHAKGLGVHLGELGGDRDHEHGTASGEAAGGAGGPPGSRVAALAGGAHGAPTLVDPADASRRSRALGS